MNRILVLILVVFSCTTGCIAVNSRALTASADALQDQDAPLASSRQSDADNAPVMVSLRRGELDFDILPIGSYVSIDCEQDHKYQGTVVHRTQSRLELANCLRKSPVVSEEGLTQLATQCVPLQVVDKPTVTGLKIMSLPSRKLDPTKLRFEGDDTEVAALEFHSGYLGEFPCDRQGQDTSKLGCNFAGDGYPWGLPKRSNSLGRLSVSICWAFIC